MDCKTVWVLVIIVSLSLAFSNPDLLVSAEPSAKWIKAFDNGGDDEAYTVKIDDDGFIFAGITNFDTFGGYDAWLIKMDFKGEMQWSRNYGGLFSDGAYSLVTTIDGGYAFAGSTNSYGVGNADVCWLRLILQVTWNGTRLTEDRWMINVGRWWLRMMGVMFCFVIPLLSVVGVLMFG